MHDLFPPPRTWLGGAALAMVLLPAAATWPFITESRNDAIWTVVLGMVAGMCVAFVSPAIHDEPGAYNPPRIARTIAAWGLAGLPALSFWGWMLTAGPPFVLLAGIVALLARGADVRASRRRRDLARKAAADDEKIRLDFDRIMSREVW